MTDLPIVPGPGDALVLVDVQNDFLPPSVRIVGT